LKVLYLVATQRRKNRTNPSGRINAWKPILNTLTIHYGGEVGAKVTTPATHGTDGRSRFLRRSGLRP
jgi:hypothetical protein